MFGARWWGGRKHMQVDHSLADLLKDVEEQLASSDGDSELGIIFIPTVLAARTALQVRRNRSGREIDNIAIAFYYWMEEQRMRGIDIIFEDHEGKLQLVRWE